MTGRPAGPLLTQRQLNRSLLARQLLLERADLTAEAAIEHLIGLQAQKPDPPHLALFARLRRVRTADIDELIDQRRAVRIAAMRSTIHLLNAADALRIRPAIQPALDRELAGQKIFRSLDHVDMAAVAARGRALCAARPLTFKALGAALHAEFGQADPHALAIAVRNHVSLVQLPPRGRWRTPGPLTHTPIEVFLGVPEVPGTELVDLIPRYLRAFGPATAADITAWSGVPGVRAILDGIADRLRHFTDERGRELVDVPDGLLPDPDTPAPVRLLPEYDNALLSHADRTRVVDEDVRRAGLVVPTGQVDGTVLVDGRAIGLWRSDHRERGGSGETLAVRMLRPMTARQRGDLEREALAMLEFGDPGGVHRVEFDS